MQTTIQGVVVPTRWLLVYIWSAHSTRLVELVAEGAAKVFGGIIPHALIKAWLGLISAKILGTGESPA